MKDMKDKKRFAFDVGITFIASILNMLLGFILMLILVRYLGASDYGLYRVAFTIYIIAILVAETGIPTVMIKYVAEYKEDENKINSRDKTNKIVSAGILISIFFGIIFTVIIYFSSGLFERIFGMQGLSSLLKLLSPVFPFALLSGVMVGLLNGLREMKKFGVAMIVQSALMVIVTITLIYNGYGVSGAVIGIVLSLVGNCLFLIWFTKGYFEITFREYFQTTRKMLNFGWKIIATAVINQINYQADIILIAYFLTAADVGNYGMVAGITKFFRIAPEAIGAITFPATSEYWQKGNHLALQKMINKSLVYAACILLPIGLGTGFFAKEIVNLLFGQDFLNSILPLQILTIGNVIFCILLSVGSFLTGVGRPDLSLKINIIGAIVNLLLDVMLIPQFGISGAALARVISIIAITVLSLYIMIKIGRIKINIKPFVQLSIITVSAIVLFISLNRINIYLIGFLILCIYIFVIFVFILTKEDKQIFVFLIHSAINKKID